MGHEHGLWAWVWVWVWVWAWAIIPYRAMPLFFRTDFVSGTPYFGAFCLYCVSISLLPGSLLFAPRDHLPYGVQERKGEDSGVPPPWRKLI